MNTDADPHARQERGDNRRLLGCMTSTIVSDSEAEEMENIL